MCRLAVQVLMKSCRAMAFVFQTLLQAGQNLLFPACQPPGKRGGLGRPFLILAGERKNDGLLIFFTVYCGCPIIGAQGIFSP